MAIKKNSNTRLNRLLSSGSSNSNLSKSWLYCRWVLYTLFIISIGNLYYLLLDGDYFTLAVFVLVAFLTTFFSKNMVVILSISLVISTITKSIQVKEGLELSNNDLSTIDKLVNKFGGGVKDGMEDKDNKSDSKKTDSKTSSSDSKKTDSKKTDSDSKKSDSDSKKSDSKISDSKTPEYPEEDKPKKKSKSEEDE